LIFLVNYFKNFKPEEEFRAGLKQIVYWLELSCNASQPEPGEGRTAKQIKTRGQN